MLGGSYPTGSIPALCSFLTLTPLMRWLTELFAGEVVIHMIKHHGSDCLEMIVFLVACLLLVWREYLVMGLWD